MGWLTEAIAAFLVVFIGAFVRFVQLRNKKAVRLLDTTPILKPGLHHFVSMLQLQSDGPQSQSSIGGPVVKAFREAVTKNRGHLGYLGKCVAMAEETTQFSLPTCDVVAHTMWKDLSDFEAFRAELQRTWAIHKVQAFERPIGLNMMMAAMLHGFLPLALKVKAILSCGSYALTEHRGDEPEHAEGRFSRASLLKLADIVEAGDPDEPMLWWNFEAESGPTNMKYGMGVLPFLLCHGAGGIHGGPCRQDMPTDGTFEKIVAVYYPSRRWTGQFLRSHQLHAVVHDKDPGNGMIVATVPYRT